MCIRPADKSECDRPPCVAARTGVALVVLLLAASRVSGQSAWNVTTADFKTQTVNLVGVDDAGAKVTRVHGGAETVVPWQQILQLDRSSIAPAKPAQGPTPATTKPAAVALTLYLANGDRVSGEAVELTGETLGWNAPAAGRVDVKLKEVLAIARATEPPPRRDQQRPEDVVLLTNGDAARGLVSAVDAAGITVQADGTPVTVPWDAVRTVVLAAVAGTADAKLPQRGVRVTLADGSVLGGSSFTMAADKATLGAGDAKREVAAAAVVTIEQLNGPVAWLSSLPPSESVQTPFLETTFPARTDRTVRGEPIRFGDRTFSRGLGAHAYSRLTWQLPEGGRYKSFRTQYAIDGDKPYANVTVRVKLDDKVVHETQDFVAGKLADVVQVPLAGAKTLTLEVDYGKTYDVQDRFNWIEPALLTE